MLEIRDLRFRYSRRGPLVLDGVSLTLRAGEIGILLGRNGSGKTTLFKNILGIQTPEQAAKMASLSDGAIVGSAIIKIIDQYGTEAAPHVRAYVQSMADAVHAVKDSVHGA